VPPPPSAMAPRQADSPEARRPQRAWQAAAGAERAQELRTFAILDCVINPRPAPADVDRRTRHTRNMRCSCDSNQAGADSRTSIFPVRLCCVTEIKVECSSCRPSRMMQMQKLLAAIGFVWLVCVAVVAWRDVDTRPIHPQDLLFAPMTLMVGSKLADDPRQLQRVIRAWRYPSGRRAGASRAT
jgi:hypothetical protein